MVNSRGGCLIRSSAYLQISRYQQVAAHPADAEVFGDMGLAQVVYSLAAHHARGFSASQDFGGIKKMELLDQSLVKESQRVSAPPSKIGRAHV